MQPSKDDESSCGTHLCHVWKMLFPTNMLSLLALKILLSPLLRGFLMYGSCYRYVSLLEIGMPQSFILCTLATESSLKIQQLSFLTNCIFYPLLECYCLFFFLLAFSTNQTKLNVLSFNLIYI